MCGGCETYLVHVHLNWLCEIIDRPRQHRVGVVLSWIQVSSTKYQSGHLRWYGKCHRGLCHEHPKGDKVFQIVQLLLAQQGQCHVHPCHSQNWQAELVQAAGFLLIKWSSPAHICSSSSNTLIVMQWMCGFRAISSSSVRSITIVCCHCISAKMCSVIETHQLHPSVRPNSPLLHQPPQAPNAS